MLNNLSMLDIITLIGFIAQIENIEENKIESNYIHKIIKSISDEIEKLHKENDIIIEQNKKIINLLKRE